MNKTGPFMGLDKENKISVKLDFFLTYVLCALLGLVYVLF